MTFVRPFLPAPAHFPVWHIPATEAGPSAWAGFWIVQSAILSVLLDCNLLDRSVLSGHLHAITIHRLPPHSNHLPYIENAQFRLPHSTMNSEAPRMRNERLALMTGFGSPPILKEAQSRHSEEPPAYTPTMKPSIIDNLAAYLSQQSEPYGTGPHRVASRPEVSFSSQFSDDDHEGLSPISLRISTRINVACDGNLIALPVSPSEQANSIARAVVEAIQGQDWATGLPMIDENGRPRPLKLEVDAGMSIKGSSNVIGTESIINEIIRQRTFTSKWTPPSPSQSTESSATTSPSSPKRRRRLSDAAPLEQTRGKRARQDM